ncbi:MAG: hypothetical protein ACQEQV_06115 [Fibrobacterota bacterium]
MIEAKPPRDLPGEELTEDAFFEAVVSSVARSKSNSDLVTVSDDVRDGLTWLDSVSQTWAAPPVPQQIEQDTIPIKLGMGAIFIPRMSKKNDIEPEISIHDTAGDVVATGTTGRKYNLLPGQYTVFASNVPKHPMYKDVTLSESELVPLFPDWCGLKVEVINTNGKPIRGEYDLARLGPITPIGRGKGRDINLAEALRVWLLPPGTYKIVSPGSSYNTVSNFLTLRMHPGEFVQYTVVIDEKTGNIVGGGIINPDVNDAEESDWVHNLNFGGSIDMGFTDNHRKDSTNNSLGLSALFYDRLNYVTDRIRWNNLIRADLSLSVDRDEYDNVNLSSALDELRLNSVFTYSLQEKFGPYGRGEYSSGIIPSRVNRSVENVDEPLSHYFILLDEKPDSLTDDISVEIDSVSDSYMTQPALSPVVVQAGVGGNFQILRNPGISTRMLTGFGLTWERRWDGKGTITPDEVPLDSTSTLFTDYIQEKYNTILYRIDKHRFNTGPEVMLDNRMNLGSAVSVTTEFRAFAPVERLLEPDISVSNLLSFHLAGNIIIDYDYSYKLVQAREEELKAEQSRHRVLLRFSISR